MTRILPFVLLLALLLCTSCVGLVVTSGEQVNLNDDCSEKNTSYHYCQKDPEKIETSFSGKPKRKYFKENKECWVYEDKTRRGLLIGAIFPIPIFLPWTTETTFEFENGKRIHTSTVKDSYSGILCGFIIGIEHPEWGCFTGNKLF